jgi:hypothetical protein
MSGENDDPYRSAYRSGFQRFPTQMTRDDAAGLSDPGSLGTSLTDLETRSKKIDAALAACTSAAAARPGWNTFYADFLKWARDARGAIGATAQMLFFPSQYKSGIDAVSSSLPDYQVQIDRWADIANGLCGTTINDAPPPPAASGLDYICGLTTLAAVGGVVYLLVAVLPRR